MRRTVEVSASPTPTSARGGGGGAHGGVYSKGGFSGMFSNVITLGSTTSKEQRRERELQRDFRAAQLADQPIVKLASVNLEGWEREKEVRVKAAFDRIVEHGWYDRAETTLKAIELGHINAVREHYAMRRDRIKTPMLVPPPPPSSSSASTSASGGHHRRYYQNNNSGRSTAAVVEHNTISALEWVDNVNALDQLSQTTHLENHFMNLMKRKVAARKQQQQR